MPSVNPNILCVDCGSPVRTNRKGTLRCRQCFEIDRESGGTGNLSGLCMCGCGEKTPLATYSDHRRNTKAGVPVHYLPGHRGRKYSIGYEVDKTTGCWNFQGFIQWTGYGTLAIGGRSYAAHRYYYEQKYGPIPEGLDLDHLCFNRACVNPDHCEPVTRLVNNRRKRSTKLSLEKVVVIRRLKGQMSQKMIGDLFGISQANVGRVLRGESWVEHPSVDHS